jgi:8-oxo-dGTP pyrophosphatase MutT (NUDIX family)
MAGGVADDPAMGTQRTPFTTLASELLVSNDWHCYRKDRYVRTDGGESDYYYVDMPGSAGCIPLLADGRVAMVEVTRYLLSRKLLEFPIGGMKRGEDPGAVAVRETAEETGYRPRRMTRLGSFAPYKGVSNEICHFYLGEDLEPVGQRLETTEEIRPRLVPLGEVRDLLLSAGTGDGQSLAGWLYLERLAGTPDGVRLRSLLG